jgi:hypothetical protein
MWWEDRARYVEGRVAEYINTMICNGPCEKLLLVEGLKEVSSNVRRILVVLIIASHRQRATHDRLDNSRDSRGYRHALCETAKPGQPGAGVVATAGAA